MQHLEIKVTDSVATILIGRGDVRGALNPILIDDLQTALGDLHLEQNVRSVILTGGGRHFCSGLDIAVFDKIIALDERQIPEVPDPAAASQWFTLWRSWTELLENMLRFPKPLIAAVDGPAIGAGFGLALACDMIVASDQATFAATAARHGIAGGATTTLIKFRLGAAAAARLALTGQTIDADEAYRLGLCDRPVVSDQIWVAANALGKTVADSTAPSIAACKRMINETADEAVMSALSAAAASDASLCGTDATMQQIAKFMKRTR